jgi:hypothetical protein
MLPEPTAYCIVGLFILGAVVDILKFTDGVVFECVLHVFAGLAGFGLLLRTFLHTIRNCVTFVLLESGLAIALADMTVELTRSSFLLANTTHHQHPMPSSSP